MKSLFLSILLLGVLAVAGDGEPYGSHASEISGLSDLGKSMLSYLPGDLGKAVKTYLDVMQPQSYGTDNQVAGSNAGLAKTFSKTLGSRCGKLLSETFYKDIRSHSSDSTIAILDDDNVLKSRGLEPGWVWKKALGIAEGNPNLALSLIGACGHDDTNQFFPGCPKASDDFYRAKGLGAEVDIPNDLKNYVAETQSVDLDPKKIKAKNYHFYGSAYLGCRMVENGVSPEKIPDYAQKFAYIYRRIRICRTATATGKSLDSIYEIYQQNLAKYNRSKSEGVAPTFESTMLDAYKKSQGEFSWKRLPLSASPEAISAYLKKKIAHYNASKLYAEATGCPKYSSSEKLDALQAMSLSSDINKNNLVFGPNQEKFNESCELIAGSGCADAKKVLLTWDADFKWTMAQHRAGAKFAAEKCKPLAGDSKALATPSICKNIPNEVPSQSYLPKLDGAFPGETYFKTKEQKKDNKDAGVKTSQ